MHVKGFVFISSLLRNTAFILLVGALSAVLLVAGNVQHSAVLEKVGAFCLGLFVGAAINALAARRAASREGE